MPSLQLLNLICGVFVFVFVIGGDFVFVFVIGDVFVLVFVIGGVFVFVLYVVFGHFSYLRGVPPLQLIGSVFVFVFLIGGDFIFVVLVVFGHFFLLEKRAPSAASHRRWRSARCSEPRAPRCPEAS